MPKNNSNSRKEQRRISAEVRQEDFDALTDEEKLAKVAKRVPDVTKTAEFRKFGDD